MSLSHWRQYLYYIGLVLGALLFAYQIWIGYQAVTSNALQLVPLWILGAAVGLILVATCLQIAIWAFLINILGVSITWRQVVRGYVLSAIARYIPGGIWGYLSRSQWLFQVHGIPHNLSNSASVLELVGLVAAAGVVFGGHWGAGPSGQWQFAPLFVTLVFPFAIWVILRTVANCPPLLQLSDRVGILALCSFRVPLRQWLAVVLLDLGLWLGLGGALFLIIQGWGLSQGVGILDAVFVLAASWLLGIAVVFVPAGLGVREVALSGLMVTGMGISLGTASAIAVVMRFALLAAELIYLMGVLALSK